MVTAGWRKSCKDSLSRWQSDGMKREEWRPKKTSRGRCGVLTKVVVEGRGMWDLCRVAEARRR